MFAQTVLLLISGSSQGWLDVVVEGKTKKFVRGELETGISSEMQSVLEDKTLALTMDGAVMLGGIMNVLCLDMAQRKENSEV